MRVAWTAKGSKQPILKEISPEYSLQGLMLKLKLQSFGHLMQKMEKPLMLGKIEGGRRRGRQRMRWLDSITDLMHMSLSKLWGVGYGQGSLACYSPWGRKSWTQLSDFIFTFHFHALEKEMATHSSVLAWRIPGMGDSGGLPSMGSHRVGHD